MTTTVTAPTTPSRLGRPFLFLWTNSVTFQLIATADRFTFVWLADDTLKTTKFLSGLIVFMLGVPLFLFVLPAGALADRGNRRRQLLGSQAAGALVTAAAAVLTSTGVMNVPIAVVTALLFGLVLAFATPVRSSLTPLIVPRDRLMSAIPLMTIGANIAMISGPVLAGFTIQWWGVTGAFATQSLLFVVSGLLVSRLRIPEAEQRPERHLTDEIREGVRYIRGNVILRSLLVLMSVGGACMMGPGFLLIPQIARNEFGKDADTASALFGMMGVGMMLMSFLLIRYGPRVRRRGWAFMWCMVAGSSVSILMGIAPSYMALLGLMFAWGLCGGVWGNMSQSLLQERTDRAMIGRVMSISALMHTGVAPMAALLAGALASVIGAKPTLSVFGVVGLSAVVVMMVVGRQLREV